MTKKRRNGGRNKHSRGRVDRVNCYQCYSLVPKDKAIKRFLVRNIVDASTKNDILDASCFSSYKIPQLYMKTEHCISCAVHSHIVHVRSKEDRRIRDPVVRSRPRN